MESILKFIGNYYVWILTFTIILLFALFGYIYDSRRSENDLMKKQEDELDEEALANLNITENKGLGDSLNISKNINPETKEVQLTDESILNSNESPSDNNSNIN
jgi:hypothetical protein